MMLRLLIVALLLLVPSVADAAFNFQSYGSWTAYAQYAREEAVTYDDYGSCYGQGWDMDCGAPAISCASVATNAGLSDYNNAWCEQRWTSTMMSYYYDMDGVLNAFYDHENRITVYGPGASYLGCYGSHCSQHNSTAPPASATLNANPITIVQGNSSILSWSSYDATSCTGTGFSTGGATSGQVTVTPNSTTNYSISCTGPGGSGSASRTVTVVTPQCSDGIDNDSDGLTDMGDWGCTSPTDTTEYHNGSSYTVPGLCGDTVESTINCIAAEPVTLTCSATQRAYYEPTATNKNCYSYNGYSHTTNWGTCSEDASCSASGGCYCNGHWRWNGHNWDDYGVSWEPGDPEGCQMSPSPQGTYSHTDYSVIEYRDGTIYGSGHAPQTAIGSYSTSGCTAPAVPGSASGLNATCNAAGTQATLSWSETSGATGYYVRASNPGSCPAGWTQASWSSAWCTPNPDWVSGTSVTFPTTPSTSYSWGIHAANSGGYGAWTPGTNFSCTPSAPQCSDTLNNDSDSYGADYPSDPGCTSLTDETESPNPQCSDGIDNDGDGNTDNNDTGCDGTSDNSESPNPQCSDGVNNDGSEDALVDFSGGDPGCASASDSSESPNPAAGPPVASIDADPTRVNQGEQSDISFSASNVATSCTVTGSDGYTSGAIAGPTIATTTVARTITTQTTFRITCDGVADDEDVVVVNVSPTIGEF